jgi:hypothetical protein
MPRTKQTARQVSAIRVGDPPLPTFQGRKGKKRKAGKALLAKGVESSSDESSDGDQDDDREESVDNSQRVDSNESENESSENNESKENDDNESSEDEDDINDDDGDDSVEPTSGTRGKTLLTGKQLLQQHVDRDNESGDSDEEYISDQGSESPRHRGKGKPPVTGFL